MRIRSRQIDTGKARAVRIPSEQREGGFSLIELMVVLLIFSALGAATLSLTVETQRCVQTSLKASGLLDSGLRALGQMTQEIRLAGFPAAGSFSASGLSANPGVAANSVTTATSYDLIFEADIDGDGRVEQVEYVLPAGSQTITRIVTKKNLDGTYTGAPTVSQPFLNQVQNQIQSQPLFTWQTDPSSTKPFPQNIQNVYINPILKTTDASSGAVANLILKAAGQRMNP